MEKDKQPDKPAESGDGHPNKGEGLAKRDVIGAISLIVVVAGIGAGYYAFNYINKDSVRTQFWVSFMFSFLAFVVLSVQAVIYAQQAEFMKQQAKIMQEQREISDRLATTAVRQFEITDRPWLAVDVVPISPLTFGGQGCDLSFRITAKNVGRSVAVNATINAKVIIPFFNEPGQIDLLDQIIGEQTRFCQSIGSQFMSYAIFPEHDYSLNHTFGVQQQELEQGRLPSTPKTDMVLIFLIGCVDYQFSGHSAHHQTRFVYEVFSSSTEHPDPVVISIGHTVPLERLRLRKSVVGGDYAN